MTLEDFVAGDNVNVERLEGDQFNHDFTGHVKGFHDKYVTVEDQDGDCWDCVPAQLSFSSDDIMHGDEMDGDFDSAMASAGMGTDEDYGYFGDPELCGE